MKNLGNEGAREKIFHAQTIRIHRRRASLAFQILVLDYDESTIKFLLYNLKSKRREYCWLGLLEL